MHSSGCVPCRHFGLNRVHHSRYAKVGEMCLGESQLDMVSVTLGKTEEPGKSNRPLVRQHQSNQVLDDALPFPASAVARS